MLSKLKKRGKGIVLMHDFQHLPRSRCRSSCSTQGGELQDRVHEAERDASRPLRPMMRRILKDAKLPTVRRPPDLERRAHHQRIACDPAPGAAQDEMTDMAPREADPPMCAPPISCTCASLRSRCRRTRPDCHAHVFGPRDKYPYAANPPLYAASGGSSRIISPCFTRLASLVA